MTVAAAFSTDAVLLSASGLQRSFDGNQILRDLTLEVRTGEVVLLMGDNGSGKTTLVNILTGYLAPDRGVIRIVNPPRPPVELRFPMKPWLSSGLLGRFRPEQLAKAGLGRTWQNVKLFASQTLLANIAVATPGQHGENPAWAVLRPQTVRAEESRVVSNARRRLADVDLIDRALSSADRVSLGQAKRVAIMRALESGARLLFLDEPLAGLDQQGMDSIVSLLGRVARDYSVALVIIEHIFNLPQFLHMANSIWTLKDGSIQSQPAPEFRVVATSRASTLPRWFSERVGTDKQIEKHNLLRGGVLWIIRSAETAPAAPVLDVQNVAVCRGHRVVLGELLSDNSVSGLSFSLRRGDLAVLQAPNGWGKTTLMEAIAGLVPLKQGVVRLDGDIVSGTSTWERARRGIRFLRAPANVFRDLRVDETFHLSRACLPDGLRHLSRRRGGDLSGGERQRVAMMSICSNHGRALLLDEPFSALDAKGLADVWPLVVPERSAATLVAIPSQLEEN